MLQNSTAAQTIQPKIVVIRRRPNQGFGFTLRHFIAYPPEDDPSWLQEASDPYHQVKAMETIFIKEVQPNGPAHYANLQTGDRVLMVNNTPIAGIAYSTIVSMIKQTPSVLTLHVVPKECDVLQMHYTSIAHTPESNRLAAIPKPIPSPLTVVGNGNAAGALIPLSSAAAKSFPQQQLISYAPVPHNASSAAAAVIASSSAGQINNSSSSRSGSISSTANSNLRSLTIAGGGGGAVSDFNDMSAAQNLHHSTLLLRSDGGFVRSQPPSLTVLSRQQQQQQQQQLQQQQQNIAIYPPTAADTSDLMIRLRESIKQKEEFLKSPIPLGHQQQSTQQQQQHFFPHTPPSGSPQLSMISTSTTSAGSSAGLNTIGGAAARAQMRSAYVKQPVSASSSTASSTRELLPANCEIQTYYTKNFPANFVTIESIMNRCGNNGAGAAGVGAFSTVTRNQQLQLQQQQQHQQHHASNVNALRDKYVKDYDYLESLQETGVTNKVFERKLVTHMSKGFDPFKPLSINTNAIESTAAPGNVIMLKKPILYESLQHHPLHQLQLQQLQQSQVPKLQHVAQISSTYNNNGSASNNHTSNSNSSNSNSNSISITNSVVDGQQCSRMEVHKASLAKTTIDHHHHQQQQYATGGKYITKLPEAEEKPMTTPTTVAAAAMHATATTIPTTVTTLSDIAEIGGGSGGVGGDMLSMKATTSSSTDVNVVRRFKPMSSFDDSKPMRRISYLRATNNENDYQSDTSSIATTTSTSGGTTTTVEATITKAHIEEDPGDPTYDVVAGDEPEIIQNYIIETDDVRRGASTAPTVAIVAAAEKTTASDINGSRRASMSSEMRNSIHIDNILLDLNGKLETKDVSTEMEIFETEMEIKSSCINGKRISEYRSWRQVKIEIKGDILRIYPCRHSKSDNNVIELDIKNFNIFDESVDKKKYIFRMQSKPVHIATLGNELNIDECAADKLTSSGSSASTAGPTTHTLQLEQQQNTEILFKTKSCTEMKRIFGLLQWKNSFIYDDSDLQGKQLAEPQKTAATASMPTATYCDDNVQQQPQQQQQTQLQLLPDCSPLSATSRSGGGAGGDLETSDSISPVMKTRKSSSHKNIPDKDLGSPKAKNWKDLLFRRGGGGSSGSSHSADISPSNLASTNRTIGSIGVPLKTCPMSKCNEYVPHIVEVCTNIVETKGLGIVGIYRIPGNKAAISELSDQVNKHDFTWDRCNTDVRWEDVNVVSSLLKLFIRSLPDALLPCSFYINFIEADKKTGLVRLRELKELLESLPRYSYETMKHLIRHLNRVSKHCDVNLMEPKNLAIIFGPSIIRTPNDTLEIAVKDMKHQCRIVELLVTQYDYFFENGTTPDIEDVSGNIPIATTSSGAAAAAAAAQSQEEQTNMLLDNVSKIERLTERETTRTSRFIPQLRRRTHSKRSAVSSDTYSGESVLSLDYSKTTHTASSSSSSNVAAVSSGSSSSTIATSSKTTVNTTKKKERSFLTHSSRAHHRKASLDEKESGSSGGVGGGNLSKEKQRSSVDISILLTDDESSNSRNSDTGSMSLTTITDTLDSKLRNLRSGSESNDENGSPEFPKNRRHTFGQPLHLHSENIPFADESPERHFHNACSPLDAPNVLMLSRSMTATNTIGTKSAKSDMEKVKAAANATTAAYKSNKLQHSATAPIHTTTTTALAANEIRLTTSTPNAASTPTSIVTTMKSNSGGGNSAGSARNSYTSKNLRFSSSVYEQVGSGSDSEGSTTSDPKESLVITSPSFFLERYNKKRRDHRLFRSASFNCRNYSTRHAGSGGALTSTLTKDEKTDMNLTKKRQIQNKQNRSIKRRHTVGGPHDYSTTTITATASTGGGKSNNASVGNGAIGGAGSTTTTTTVLRRIPIPSANGNITNNNNNNNLNNNNNSSQQSDSSSSNGNSSSSGGGGAANLAVANGAGEHVLEVGIRIKNINRSRY